MGFPRQEYWSGCHSLIQGLFLTQGLNLRLLHWQEDSLPLRNLGSPNRELHWSFRMNRKDNLEPLLLWIQALTRHSFLKERDLVELWWWEIYHKRLTQMQGSFPREHGFSVLPCANGFFMLSLIGCSLPLSVPLSARPQGEVSDHRWVKTTSNLLHVLSGHRGLQDNLV